MKPYTTHQSVFDENETENFLLLQENEIDNKRKTIV